MKPINNFVLLTGKQKELHLEKKTKKNVEKRVIRLKKVGESDNTKLSTRFVISLFRIFF